jgi:hypothetical protein
MICRKKYPVPLQNTEYFTECGPELLFCKMNKRIESNYSCYRIFFKCQIQDIAFLKMNTRMFFYCFFYYFLRQIQSRNSNTKVRQVFRGIPWAAA